MEESGEIIRTSHVVITTGTFLGGEIHIGNSQDRQLTERRDGMLACRTDGRSTIFEVKPISQKCWFSIGKIENRNSPASKERFHQFGGFKAASF
jgi:hypothetical protein